MRAMVSNRKLVSTVSASIVLQGKMQSPSNPNTPVKSLLTPIALSITMSCLAIAEGNNPRMPVSASVQKMIEAKLPSGAHIESIDLKNFSALIDGTAATAGDVSQLMRRLADDQNVDSVELVEVSSQNTNARFSINLSLQCTSSNTDVCRAPPPPKTTYKCNMNDQIVYQDKPCAKQ